MAVSSLWAAILPLGVVVRKEDKTPEPEPEKRPTLDKLSRVSNHTRSAQVSGAVSHKFGVISGGSGHISLPKNLMMQLLEASICIPPSPPSALDFKMINRGQTVFAHN
jgi:hypothetical protein